MFDIHQKSNKGFTIATPGKAVISRSGIFSGFTLAETLITLMVIGVVAALTIPAMMQNWQDRRYVSAYKKMYSTIMNGFNQMIAEETISGHNSTEEFVQEMGKYFKFSATCDKDNLKNCFTEKIKTDDKEIELSKIKTSKNLGKDWSTNTNVNGIKLSDGTSMLIAYNKDGCAEHANKREDQVKSCVAIVFDLDSPTKGGKYSVVGENGKCTTDIAGYNAALNSGADCGTFGPLDDWGENWGFNGPDGDSAECQNELKDNFDSYVDICKSECKKAAQRTGDGLRCFYFGPGGYGDSDYTCDEPSWCSAPFEYKEGGYFMCYH